MQPTDIVQALGAALLLLLLAAVLGIVLAFVAGVRWVRERRASPLLGAGGVVLPLVAGVAGAALCLGALDRDPSAAVAGTLGYRLITVVFAAPAALVLLIFGAVAGTRTGPRRWARAGALLALPLLTAGITLLGGWWQGDLAYPALRAVAYAVVGMFLALSGVGSSEGTSPEAVASSGAVFALCVAAGEASARALERLFLVMVMTGASDRTAYLDTAWAQVIRPAAPWHLAAVIAAMVAGLVALLPALAAGRRRALWALPWILLAPAVLYVGSPGRAAVDVLAVHTPVAPAPPPPSPL